VNPRAADLVRKVSAGVLSIAVTVLLFRVMFRAAQGRASLVDWELWLGLGLLALGIWWVRAARRVQGPPQG
jgi:hypothetical protein